MQIYEQDPNIAFECGHCQRRVSAPVGWRVMTGGDGAVAVICTACRGASVFKVGPRVGGAETRPDGSVDHPRMVLDQRPRPSIIEYNHRVVPEPVARRFVDVQRAINAGLWEQAITTARTAVQVMARLERVDRGTLQQEIERLVDARGDQLASIIRSLAHRIRDAGNDAVHPDDPDWSPTKEEAHEAFVFLQALIEWLYALPARLAVAEQAETEATQQDAEPETAV